MQNGVKHRLRQAIYGSGLSQQALANALGISRQSVGQMVDGRNPGRKHWVKIAELCKTTAEWIASGTGEQPTWANPQPQPLREHEAIEKLDEIIQFNKILLAQRDARIAHLENLERNLGVIAVTLAEELITNVEVKREIVDFIKTDAASFNSTQAVRSEIRHRLSVSHDHQERTLLGETTADVMASIAQDDPSSPPPCEDREGHPDARPIHARPRQENP